MITVENIYREIDSLAPFCTQEKWDNSGLLAGDMSMPVRRIYICLDISNEAVSEAKKIGADLIFAA